MVSLRPRDHSDRWALPALQAGRRSARAVSRPAVREALGRAIEDLDETIRRIRSAIFTLQKPKASMDARAVLLEVVRSSTAGLGFEPTLRLE